MKKYLLKRLLRLIPVFLGVTILAFLLTGLSSVDAVDLKESSSGGVMSEAEKEAVILVTKKNKSAIQSAMAEKRPAR